jgi:hypothetical protein
MWIWGVEISLNWLLGWSVPLFSAILFRTAADAECIWHVKGQHKVNVGLYAVEFLCTFCKSSDGASLTTGEHLVRI